MAKTSNKPGGLRRLLRFVVIAAAIIAAAIAVIFAVVARDLPDPQEVLNRPTTESTKIYDRTGTVLLYEVHGEVKRTIIDFTDIPVVMRQAIVAAEDDQFYSHHGVNFKSMIRAALQGLRNLKVTQGASTITQQFIKNSLLTPERTIVRKIKEIILALELERRYSKDQILGFYLNQVPFGANAYGVEAASETYFNKPAKDLDLAEASTLAALVKRPSYLSPYGSHPEALANRRSYVLDRMTALGFVSQAQRDRAKNETLAYAPQAAGIKAPHFVFFVRDYLEEKYGKDAVETGGLKVTTTLDWPLESQAEQLVAAKAASNEKRYNAGNAAAVAIDPKTGQILSMAGSRNYFDLKHDGNVNVVTRLRQPGSAFKPFAYAAAFAKGYTPDTILFDLQTVFLTSGNVSYLPENYDGRFRGPVTMREGLAQSLNVPSVKTLYLAGIEDTIKTAERLGVTSLKDRSRFDLALVLGGAEVTPLEMTAAYAAFGADGVYHPPAAILKVEDGQGTVLETYHDAPQAAIDPEVSRLVTDILSDNAARAPVFGDKSPLLLDDRPAAAKTGTTQNYRDAWTIGYTPDLAVGVWTGNNDNAPMYRGGAGIMAAGPLWHDLMTAALKGTPATLFPKPQPVVTGKAILDGRFASTVSVRVDKLSGKLATDLTPPDLIEDRIYQEVHSILYYVNKNDPRGPVPTADERDPAFPNWELPVQDWVKNQPDAKGYNQPPPAAYDDIHIADNQPVVTIVSPLANQTFNPTDTITVQASATAKLPVKQVDFLYDDELVGTSAAPPFGVSFSPSRTGHPEGGTHTIAAKAYDQALNVGAAAVALFITGPANSPAGAAGAPSVTLANPPETAFPYTLTANVANPPSAVQDLTFYYSFDAALTRSFTASSAAADASNLRFQAAWSKPANAGSGPIYVYAAARLTDGSILRSNILSFNQ